MGRFAGAASLRVLLLCGLTSGTAAAVQSPPPVIDRSGAPKTGPQTRPPAPKAGRPAEVGEDDVLRVDTTLVAVPVSVTDRAGKHVPELRMEDFRVYEDGVEQEIVYFGPVEKPFTVALLLDTSDSLRFRLQDVQDAAIAFVERLRPEDRVMVMSFSSRLEILCELTSDREVLRRAIRRSHTQGGTRVYDVIDFAVNQRLDQVGGLKKAIILFTDGVDTGSFHSTRESNFRDLEESDVLVYPVHYSPNAEAGGQLRDASASSAGPSPALARGGGVDQVQAAHAAAYLNALSSKTGARLYRAETLQGLRQAFAHIAAELRRQYSLGYYPKAPPQAGQRRRIRVSVNQPGLLVRARHGYVFAAPAEDSPERQ